MQTAGGMLARLDVSCDQEWCNLLAAGLSVFHTHFEFSRPLLTRMFREHSSLGREPDGTHFGIIVFADHTDHIVRSVWKKYLLAWCEKRFQAGPRIRHDRCSACRRFE